MKTTINAPGLFDRTHLLACLLSIFMLQGASQAEQVAPSFEELLALGLPGLHNIEITSATKMATPFDPLNTAITNKAAL